MIGMSVNTGVTVDRERERERVRREGLEIL